MNTFSETHTCNLVSPFCQVFLSHSLDGGEGLPQGSAVQVWLWGWGRAESSEAISLQDISVAAARRRPEMRWQVAGSSLSL